MKCEKEEHASFYQDHHLEDRKDYNKSEAQDQSEVEGAQELEDLQGTSDDHDLVIDCASRGFHEYRKIWLPKLGQRLTVKRDKANLFDPYSIGLYCQIKGKIEKLSIVGHLPREISRFCKFYLEYNGVINATV